MFIVPGPGVLNWFYCLGSLLRMFYSSILQWGPGAKPRQGGWGRSPPEAGAFLKYTAWNLRPGENVGHNLMPLMAFCYWMNFSNGSQLHVSNIWLKQFVTDKHGAATLLAERQEWRPACINPARIPSLTLPLSVVLNSWPLKQKLKRW